MPVQKKSFLESETPLLTNYSYGLSIMSYSVKEIFYTLQGEGLHSGRPSVFCRFSGCNMWTGKEEDRNSSSCYFCDTDFVGTDGSGGGSFDSAASLATAIAREWPKTSTCGKKYVVFTGGEPLLQLDKDIIGAVHNQAFEVGIETNGTLPVPDGIDWICVSPKAGAALEVKAGSELKLIFPLKGLEPEKFEKLDFEHFYLQPMDGSNREENIKLAVRYCMEHPKWKLSLQAHKLLGIR